MYFIPLDLQGAYPRYEIPLDLQVAYPRYEIHTSVFAVYGFLFQCLLLAVLTQRRETRNEILPLTSYGKAHLLRTFVDGGMCNETMFA